jgi:hypothetical protein
MKKWFLAITITAACAHFGSAGGLDLVWPVDRPLQISGSFAEYRGARFHYGIDVGCDGKKGYRVFAAAKGSIVKVIYQNYGIGYCVVIRHDGGYETLYGHLDSFASKIFDHPKIAARRVEIEDHIDFRENLREGEITVAQGELIGFTGDSGIGPEHLHFELTDLDGNPLNPLRYGLAIPDTIPPVIERVLLVPLDGKSTINGLSDRYEIPLVKANGRRISSHNGSLRISGRIGILIDVYDTGGGKSHTGIYRGSVIHDGKNMTAFTFDTFRTDEGRFCPMIYDIEHSTLSEYRYYLYDRVTGSGTVDVNAGSATQTLSVRVADATGNETTFDIAVERENEPAEPVWMKKINCKRGQSLTLRSDDGQCTLEIPSKSVIYDEEVRLSGGPFVIDRAPAGIVPLTRLYNATPFNLSPVKPVRIRITLPKGATARAGIYSIDEKGIVRAVWSVFDKKRNELIAETRRLASFFAARDESAPVIHPPKTVTSGEPIPIRITDTGSGVDPQSVRITIDGKPVKFYHDADRGAFIILPQNEIWGDGEHQVVATASDTAGNAAEKCIATYSFTRGKLKSKVKRSI